MGARVAMTEDAYQRYLNLAPTTEARTSCWSRAFPGAGKSTLAESLARTLRRPVVSMDWVLGTMTPFDEIGDDIAVSLVDLTIVASVARHVQLGIDVVVDAAGHTRRERERLRELTERLGGVFVGVECACSDERLHRERIEGRDRAFPAGGPRCRGRTSSGCAACGSRGRTTTWWGSAVETPDSSLKRVLDALG